MSENIIRGSEFIDPSKRSSGKEFHVSDDESFAELFDEVSKAIESEPVNLGKNISEEIGKNKSLNDDIQQKDTFGRPIEPPIDFW